MGLLDVNIEYEVPIEVLLTTHGWEYKYISYKPQVESEAYPFSYCQTKVWVKSGEDKDNYHYQVTYFPKGSLVKDYPDSKLKKLRKPLIVAACRIKYSNGPYDRDPQYAREYSCWRMSEYDVIKLVEMIENANLEPNSFKRLFYSSRW